MSEMPRPHRQILNTASLEWHSRSAEGGGDSIATKVLRINEDFSHISITRSPTGAVGPAHVHVGPAEVFFLEGEVETVAGWAGKGCWVLEPAGAMHRATRTLVGGAALSHVKGPLLLLDETGAAPMAMYGESLKALVSGAAASAGADPAALTAAMYPEDYDSGVVRLETLPLLPSGYDGVEFKVVRVSEDGGFVLLVEAKDGAAMPPRRFTAPADFYVVEGCISFGDATAPAEHWVYEPLGAVESAVTHQGHTTYLATFEGAVLDLGPGSEVTRILDGYSLRELLGSTSSPDDSSVGIAEPLLSGTEL